MPCLNRTEKNSSEMAKNIIRQTIQKFRNDAQKYFLEKTSNKVEPNFLANKLKSYFRTLNLISKNCPFIKMCSVKKIKVRNLFARWLRCHDDEHQRLHLGHLEAGPASFPDGHAALVLLIRQALGTQNRSLAVGIRWLRLYLPSV